MHHHFLLTTTKLWATGLLLDSLLYCTTGLTTILWSFILLSLPLIYWLALVLPRNCARNFDCHKNKSWYFMQDVAFTLISHRKFYPAPPPLDMIGQCRCWLSFPIRMFPLLPNRVKEPSIAVATSHLFCSHCQSNVRCITKPAFSQIAVFRLCIFAYGWLFVVWFSWGMTWVSSIWYLKICQQARCLFSFDLLIWLIQPPTSHLFISQLLFKWFQITWF